MFLDDRYESSERGDFIFYGFELVVNVATFVATFRFLQTLKLKFHKFRRDAFVRYVADRLPE